MCEAVCILFQKEEMDEEEDEPKPKPSKDPFAALPGG